MSSGFPVMARPQDVNDRGRSPGIEGICKHAEEAFAENRQGVILQLRIWVPKDSLPVSCRAV
jgi:hypothetical protein